MNITRAAIMILLAILVFESCSGLKDIENYKGDNISMGVGEFASLKLKAETTDGYDWVVSSNSDGTVAKFESKENIAGENGPSDDSVVIKFKGLKKGKTIVTLNCVKKGDFIAKKTRTVNITVY